MSLLAILLVLGSALCHALKSFFIKQSSDKQVFLWCYCAAALVMYFPLFAYFAIREPMPLYEIFLWCTLTGYIHFLYQIFFTKSYESGDLSLVYPIMRSSPALVLVCAIFFLGEEVTFRGAAGIILVVSGIYVINMKRISFDDLLQPMRSLFTDRATRFAFLTMLTVAGYSIVDKLGAERIHPVIFSYLLSVFTFSLFTPWVFSQKSLSLFKDEWSVNKKSILVNGLLSKGGYLLILIAFTFEKVSYVAGFRQLSIVFAVLLGSHFLKEEGKYVRLFSAVVIFAGAFLIASAN